ncbi:MAG TPA: hypothetical protein DEH22_08390 [Chloroflexi bacterium]|nr:hypothetical protein [Chloroflexota bacterium]
MSFEAFALPAVILLALAAVILLVSYDWRLSLSALGVMYLGVFVLVAFSWPLEMAVAKLVTGWISASVLGMSLVNLPVAERQQSASYPSEIIFRVSSAGLVGLVAISLTPSVQNLLNATYEQALGGLLLSGLGVLHLGFTAQPLKIIIGLLTILAGFEILYASVESSVLVAGLMAVIDMGVALVGAYLLLAPTLEAEE